MKTMVFGRMVRGPRTRGDQRPDDGSMEFADLLDSVAPRPQSSPGADLDGALALADLVMFPVPRRVEHHFLPRPEPVEAVQEPVEMAPPDPVEEEKAAPPAKVSRFAGAGLDDDLLPVHAPRQRRLRR